MFIKAKFTVYNYTKINRFKSVSQLHTTNSIQMTTIITLLYQYVILHTCEETNLTASCSYSSTLVINH